MSDPGSPEFLDYLDDDPDRAFTEFYRFAMASLRSPLPEPMRGLTQDEIEDLLGDIIYHCVRNDFRVLRTYENVGKNFGGWLHVVAHNKALDYRRSTDRKPPTVDLDDRTESPKFESLFANPGPSPEAESKARGLLQIVRSTLDSLGQYCRLLLEMAADEFTPKEMVEALRLPEDQNKKVSDDLRYCRQRLRNQLTETGVDLSVLNLG